MSHARAQAIMLAGPSGAGKSRLALRLGLPILQLDDFYKNGDDPSLPRLPTGEVDWDHPDSWCATDAVRVVHELCAHGEAVVPTYDIGGNAQVGSRRLSLGGAPCFVAEGIFAAELAPRCLADGTAALAICLRRSRWATFALRLVRDLRERRKPALFLLRRGLLLARREPDIVASIVANGCEAMTPNEAERRIRRLVDAASAARPGRLLPPSEGS
jgi:uridine kinase